MLVGRGLRGWATVLCHLTAQWHVSAGVMYSHLVGDAADSPIVDDRGSNGRRRTSRCGRPSGAPRRYRTTVVSNAGTGSYEVAERVTEAGATVEIVRPLGLRYPNDVFSLSHVALPFPEDDPVYGAAPDPAEDFGVQLGAMALRGERGARVVSLDALGRTSWNPFFPYQLRRIEEGIGSGLR
jgi:hypothetical protein